MTGSFIVTHDGEIVEVDDETSAMWAGSNAEHDAYGGDEPEDEDVDLEDVPDTDVVVDEIDGVGPPYVVDAAPFIEERPSIALADAWFDEQLDEIDEIDLRLDALSLSAARIRTDDAPVVHEEEERPFDEEFIEELYRMR